MSKTGVEVEPDPQLERRTRRRFSAAEKQRLLSESEQLAHGEQGAWLRRNGLYAAQLSMWHKQQISGGSTGLEPKSPGRKPKDASVRELEQLRRENARLQRRAEIAEQLFEIQENSANWSRTRSTGAAHDPSFERPCWPLQEAHLRRPGRAQTPLLRRHPLTHTA